MGGVFTIPAGTPFVDSLAEGLALISGADPLALARISVLLPNRRAALSLREAFLRRSDGAAVLLPRLSPIGDIDADELDLTLPGGLDLPPALDGLRRQMLLAGLLAPTDFAPSAVQAADLAGDLAGLIDQVGTERVDFARLKDLAPDRYAEHWQMTLRFLEVLTQHWPQILESQGASNPAERREALVRMLIGSWQASPPDHPVVIAGSIGTIPVTADLIAAVAQLPSGYVVLPGLDRDIPPAEWDELIPTHPQYGLKQILSRLGLTPQEIRDWPGTEHRPSPRARLLSLAMAPDPARGSDVGTVEAVSGLWRLDCPTPHSEAAAIALALREVLEIPGKRAALVTPDRHLARRVAVELRRAGVEVDDSAGQPLATSVPGIFLRLVVEAVQEDLAPAPLLALLKHPLTGLGWDPAKARSEVRHLERRLLRGQRPPGGIAGLRAACALLPEADRERPLPLIAKLEQALAELTPLIGTDKVPLGDLAAAHIRAAEALAASDSEPGAHHLWAGQAGAAAADFLAELLETGSAWGQGVRGEDYPALFGGLLAARAVRSSFGTHPRLAIWGPIESRLQQVDRLVLGGLNEGSWPAEPADDPWMSRPMRRDFGLPPLELRIGQSAHDFAQAFAAPEVILTRAARADGTPTVPSRWLQRLDVTLTALGAPPLPAGPWLDYVRALDAPPAYRAAPMPRPCPPLDKRPRKLSVTRIETLRRDPYALYASHILKLRVLDPLDKPVDPAERGTIIHGALETFVQAYPADLPKDAYEKLLAEGRKAFGALLNDPAIERFWWPKFEQLADWLIAQETERRPLLAEIGTEVQGAMVLSGFAGGDFILEGRADRVERHGIGSLSVIDYKTGQPPAPKLIQQGYAPQLPLLGAIGQAGGFKGFGAAPIATLEFWYLGAKPKIQPVAEARKAADATYTKQVIDDAVIGLRNLIAHFDTSTAVYLPRVKPGKYGGDYDHLARTREWGGAGDGS
ncbi:double-strand break repair protein AddB [Lacibacterium aquatile]|uniref:Double-strand break repair protein AddB n=1 Tax=Lacibacterium aquatile TaxID=1168082 RepID=A0ABW5DSX8_9PROT